MGHVKSESRSLGQILGNPCVRTIGHIFSLTFMKFCQNFCPDKMLDECENGSCVVKN